VHSSDFFEWKKTVCSNVRHPDLYNPLLWTRMKQLLDGSGCFSVDSCMHKQKREFSDTNLRLEKLPGKVFLKS